jgi:outer membrane receptor protein involved in Fe transport
MKIYSAPTLRDQSRRRSIHITWLMFLCVHLSSWGQQAITLEKAKAKDREVVELQTLVVTGSNIKRLDMEKVLPVTIITKESMEARNAFTPVDLLTSLPQVTNVPLNETQTGSSGARGDNASINLRNIGSGSTLILINGRRLAPNPMTQALTHSVNVNHLPTQGIDHIEVLRDGASAVYGSDAIGGVVNYVMRRDFIGTELKVRYGFPEAGDGQYVQTALTFGKEFAGGRGRFMTTIETLYRDSIYLRNRDFTATANHVTAAPVPFNALGSAFDGTTTRGYYPTFQIGTATTKNYFRPVNGVITLTTTGPTKASNPEFYYDPNQTGMAQPRSSRLNSFFSLEYDLSKHVTFFSDFSFYKSASTMIRQPLVVNAPTTDKLQVMSVDNPYNPYGSRFYDAAGVANSDGTVRLTGAPRAISLVSVTLPGLQPEKVTTTGDVYRITAGFRGKIADTWTWETATFYNSVKGVDKALHDVRESLLQLALMQTGKGTAYNPFGYNFKVQGGAVVADQPYTNPDSVVAGFESTFGRGAKSSIASIDAHATGRVYTLWGGDIMAALGAEYRGEDLKDIRDAFGGENPASSGLDPLDNDFLLHPPRPDVHGDRKVGSVYAEAVIPLVAAKNHIALFNTLEVTASARYERYSDFGSTTNPKVGINWKPFPTVMIRASTNDGFIAPSLSALYTSARWTAGAGTGSIDLYRNPVTLEGGYSQRTYFGGNTQLKASNSKGNSAGIVFDVPKIKGLSLSADYWEISRTNVVGQRGVGDIYISDTFLLQAYITKQLAAGTPVGSIDLGSGTAGYKGDPDVARIAPTTQDIATFAAYNAANPTKQQAVAGRIFSSNTFFFNLAEGFDSGWDLGLNYVLPTLPIGKIVLNTDWAYLIKSSSTSVPPNSKITIADNLNSNGATRWRGTTTVSWRKGNWSAVLGAYYMGASQEGTTTTAALYDSLGQPSYLAKIYTNGAYQYRYVLRDVLTLNSSLAYRFGHDAREWLRNTTVRCGVINLADISPPLAAGAFGYNPAVHGGLIVGRTWTLDLTKSF